MRQDGQEPILKLSPLGLAVLEKLTEANLVYQSGLPRETLMTLASIFAEDLQGENVESVIAAFNLHRKRAMRFPTPAHIIALLPECRVFPERTAIPQQTGGKQTRGFGKLVCDAVRGDVAAREVMSKLIAKTCRECSA